ncbi:hypothetical protein FPQ18DRAFT_282177 [Pyronema domesticum]|nr:hypothetical protein FPQ18DRAFT_282177 [Pyronema domesticum]
MVGKGPVPPVEMMGNVEQREDEEEDMVPELVEAGRVERVMMHVEGAWGEWCYKAGCEGRHPIRHVWKRQSLVSDSNGKEIKVFVEKDKKERLRVVKAIRRGSKENQVGIYKELLVLAIFTKYEVLFIQFHGWFTDSEITYITTEYFPLGDLDSNLRASPYASTEEVAKDIIH